MLRGGYVAADVRMLLSHSSSARSVKYLWSRHTQHRRKTREPTASGVAWDFDFAKSEVNLNFILVVHDLLHSLLLPGKRRPVDGAGLLATSR